MIDPESARLIEEQGVLPTIADCITCHGEGTFRWRALDDYNRIEEYQCDCVEQRVLHLWFLNAGIEKSYQRLSWHDVEAEEGAVSLVRYYMEVADLYIEAGCSLILYGEKGSGKTLLSTLLLKHLVAHGMDGFFVPFWKMIALFTEGWRDPEKALWFRRRIENVPILVLDDVGKENMVQRKEDGVLKDFSTSVVGKTFDAVLRHRTASSRPTILTTNFDLDQLKSGYGTNIFSLLEERSTTYRFQGDDFRATKHRERFHFELENGLRRPIVVG